MRLFFRFWLVVFVFLFGIISYIGRRVLSGRLSRYELEHLRGDVLASAFQRLGATFVKLGQVLSTRPDLLGPGYTDALARLQDAVAPIAFEKIRAVLEEELSAGDMEQFARIEESPIAAASVAQVHEGVLLSGEEVAIKVQRPNARKQVERDLALLKFFAGLVDKLPSMSLLSFPGAAALFAEAMRNQLDFRLEAQNNERFAKNFEELEGVRVPALHRDLCSERVLTMELIDGVRATDLETVGGDRKLLARRGLDMILQMVFKDGFVHADLHPGNIFCSKEGNEIILIDLGLIAEIAPEMMGPWVQTFGAIGSYDGKAAARLFYGYAPTVDESRDYAKFEGEIVEQFEKLRGKALHELEASKMLGEMLASLRRYRVRVDPVFTVANLAMVVAEGLGKQLDPELDLIAYAMPTVAQAIMNAPPAKPMLREPPTTS